MTDITTQNNLPVEGYEQSKEYYEERIDYIFEAMKPKENKEKKKLTFKEKEGILKLLSEYKDKFPGNVIYISRIKLLNFLLK